MKGVMMDNIKYLILLSIVIGCTKAPNPIITIDQVLLNKTKNITLSEITNATSHQEVTPIVEKNLNSLLSEKYNLVSENPDAIVKCMITQYIPLESKIVESGKDATHDIRDFEDTKRKAKEGRGCLWRLLVDILIPSYKITSREKYKHHTVTRSPTIETKLTMTTQENKIIYEGCKFISSETRIPKCYSTTYKAILPEERLNSINFISTLTLKELINPNNFYLLTKKPKNLSTAMLLSFLCPGAGQFYVHNYWKGIIDFGIEALLFTGTLLSWKARENAPLEPTEKMSREDCTLLSILCGIGLIGYHIFQIVRLNDDVVVYNYKKHFLENYSLGFNFTPQKYSILCFKNF
jgi:hypothetical protein